MSDQPRATSRNIRHYDTDSRGQRGSAHAFVATPASKPGGRS